jgi:hypothetical protein
MARLTGGAAMAGSMDRRFSPRRFGAGEPRLVVNNG